MESVIVELGFNVVVPTTLISSRLSTLHHVFTLTVGVEAEGTVRAEGNVIKGHAELRNVDVKLKESSIGSLDVGGCHDLFEAIIGQMVIPKVNAKLESGIALPVVQGFHFSHASVGMKPGYMVLRTDLELRVNELDPFGFEIEQALEEEEEYLYIDYEDAGYSSEPIPVETVIVDREEPVRW
jgi:hypothetical protein